MYDCLTIGKVSTDRRGAAAVEFAVILPVVVLLLLGAVELGRGVMVQHTLQEVAHAGCRVYSVRDTTLQDAQDIVDEAMERAGITDYEVDFDPASKADIDVHMEAVKVTVTVNTADVAWLAPKHLSGTISGFCVLPADLEEYQGDSSGGYVYTDDDYEGDGNLRDDDSGGDDDDD